MSSARIDADNPTAVRHTVGERMRSLRASPGRERFAVRYHTPIDTISLDRCRETDGSLSMWVGVALWMSFQERRS